MPRLELPLHHHFAGFAQWLITATVNALVFHRWLIRERHGGVHKGSQVIAVVVEIQVVRHAVTVTREGLPCQGKKSPS